MAKIPINNFDKFIRDKVEMHQTPVDTDRLWSNIQHTGRSKRTGILPGTLLLLLVSFFITVHLLDKNNSVNNATARNEGYAEASAMAPDNVVQLISNNDISSSSKTSSENEESSVPLIRNEVLPDIDTRSSKSKSSKRQFLKNPQPLVQTVTIVEDVDNTGIYSAVIVHDLSAKSGISVTPNEVTGIITEVLNEDAYVISINDNDNLNSYSELSNLTAFEISELQSELFFPEISLLPQHAIRIQHAKFKKGFEIRMNGGVGMVLRNMELLNPEAGNWMQSRMDNEHQLEALRWGVDLKFRISDNVYFFAGLEDFRINERFDYQSIENRTYIEEGLASKIVQDENSYITERGPTEVYEEIHRRGTFYNQLRMINIPFGIGVFHKMGNFSLGLEGAVLINAYHHFDGKIADASNQLIEMQDAGLRVDKIQTARINGVLSYQLSSRWGLNLITGADLPLRSIQLGQHMSQNYMVFQGNLGICYSW